MRRDHAIEIAPDETLAGALARVSQMLETVGVEEARLDARALLLAATGLNHARLVLEPQALLGSEAAARLAGYATRRAAREPVSRILARRGFWTLDIAVAPDVLDPRADTEALLALALRLNSNRRGEPLSILDLGSGSGAILCALLAEWPAAWGVAVDISAAACAATRANLTTLGLAERGRVLRGSWADAIRGRFDFVVSNPPYVESGHIATLEPEVRRHDPMLALDGGVDGLTCYREIARALPRLLREDGIALLEAGAGQRGEISVLLEDVGLEIIGVERDAGGHERAIAARVRRAGA
ncbi:MAG: peptide chain release factor N(5)-glutamine methyltransferase [Methylocystis sp.]